MTETRGARFGVYRGWLNFVQEKSAWDIYKEEQIVVEERARMKAPVSAELRRERREEEKARRENQSCTGRYTQWGNYVHGDEPEPKEKYYGDE